MSTQFDRTGNPFPGLRPFDTDEYNLFFGRDGQSDELLARLGRTRFLAVVGTSGSGKSSLIRAGLMPALYGGLMAQTGSAWRIAVMRPGHDPIGNLAHALSRDDVIGSPDIDDDVQAAIIETTLRRSTLGLVDAVRQARLPSYENVLVVVDQFEELFRFRSMRSDGGTEDDAAAFVKLLLEAPRQRDVSLYVVLTMRSDFLGDCSQFWELPETINEGQYLIPRMTRDERREAITGPVAVGEGAISEPLVNQLLNDVGDTPDQLPIMQHALMRTWDYWLGRRTDGEPIDIPHYNAIGGMDEALSRHADEAYDELSDAQKVIAEKLFKGLTEKGADNREIRRPMEVQEICELTGADEAAVVEVVEVFRREGRSFLMPPPTDALTGAPVHITGESLVDISHESLIRNWSRLKEWTEEESQSARTYKRLAETAVLHKEGNEALLKDPALQIALDWREKMGPNSVWGQRYHTEFALAMSFLDASAAERDAAALEEERRRRRDTRRTRVAAVIFFLLFISALTAFAFAYNKSILVERANARAAVWLADAVRERNRANEQTKVAKLNEETAHGAEEKALKEKTEAEVSKAEA